MGAFWRRLVATLRRGGAERDLHAEFQFHLQSLADEFQARGMPPDEARLAARRQFGGVEQVKEIYRERRGLPVVEGLMRDLRYTIRALLRSPAFTLVVVVTLALAIGANAAIFLLLDQVVLRPLPVANPSELVVVSVPSLPAELTRGFSSIDLGPGGELVFGASYPLYQTLRRRVPLFQDVLAHRRFLPTLLAGTSAIRVNGEVVSGNYFDMLGIKAAVGRTLHPDDDRLPVGRPVVMLTYGFWQRQFGADPSVLNRIIRVNNYPLTIVGVTAPGFSGTTVGWAPDLFVPLAASSQAEPKRGYDVLAEGANNLFLMARLAPGVSREQAEKYVRGIYDSLFADALKQIVKPFNLARYRALGFSVSLLPGGYVSSQQSGVTRDLTRTLELLMAMVALVLLIAASNITNLLVARGAARGREVAIRLALGASRWRLLRERLVESLVVALLAGAASLFVTLWLVRLLPLVLPFGDRAASLALTLDRRVLTFTFSVAAATGLYLWLTSALQVTRRASLPPLTGGGGARFRMGKPLGLRRGLVVIQVALSLGLLCASTLLARSLYNLMTVDPGFEVSGLSTFSVQVPEGGKTPESRMLFLRQLLDEVRGLPGVRAVSATNQMPFSGALGGSWVAGQTGTRDASHGLWADASHVGPGYFRTIKMPLVAGRDFTEQDVTGAAKVAVVNEALASALFGRANPIGQIIAFEEGAPADIQIVGVAKDARAGPRTPTGPSIYLPCFQRPGPATMAVMVRMAETTTLSSGAVREMVKRLDPSVAVSDTRAIGDYIAEALLRDRMLATLSVCFALLAAVLTAIGLFGLTSFSVARRSHEIGVRLALGASRVSILWMVVREVAILTVVGGAAGLAAYLAVSRVLGSFLFELSPTHPPTVAAATAILATIALSAGFLPAWRAARLDPALTLRDE